MAKGRASTSLLRTAYRAANTAIGIDRRLRSSRGRGVKLVALDRSGRILLARHTYGRRHWTLPGGMVRSGEAVIEAATRELSEELGLSGLELTGLGSYPARVHRRRELVSVFSVEAGDSPISPDPVELESVGWFHPGALPEGSDPAVQVALGLLAGLRAERAAGPNRSAH